MSTTDKTLLGLCLLSLSIGLMQHGCAKKKMDHLASKPIAASASSSSNILSPNQKDQNPASPISYVVETQPREDAYLSLNAKRLIAIRERDKRLDSGSPIPLSEGFNYFAAREGFKDMLFSSSFNGGSNTLSEAEKWELIESGDLPW
ncbi:hypothetical protein P4E94_00720 [Pontiellaceae bacterium B12219]|nr:hypothetical protein [Pontiellaceae bacterium B12219]